MKRVHPGKRHLSKKRITHFLARRGNSVDLRMIFRLNPINKGFRRINLECNELLRRVFTHFVGGFRPTTLS